MDTNLLIRRNTPMHKVLWTPTERQAEALISTSFETLYGGA